MIRPATVQARATKRTVSLDNRIMLDRNGKCEETYWNWSIAPILDRGGEVIGFDHPLAEITTQKIAERRMSSLLRLGEVMGEAKDMQTYWQKMLAGLACLDEHDFPLVILYSVRETEKADGARAVKRTDNSPHGRFCRFEGGLGVPEDHACCPEEFDLATSEEGFASGFRKGLACSPPTMLRRDEGEFPESLEKGIQWRGFGMSCSFFFSAQFVLHYVENVFGDTAGSALPGYDYHLYDPYKLTFHVGEPSSALMVYPLRCASDVLTGFLLVGLNSRRPDDDESRRYVRIFPPVAHELSPCPEPSHAAGPPANTLCSPDSSPS